MGSQVSRDTHEHRMRQSGPARGGHSVKSASVPFLFYLLLYFHLVVQVMRAGVSLGRGSMKADFLIIKKKRSEKQGGKNLVKTCIGRKHFTSLEIRKLIKNRLKRLYWFFRS